MVRGGRQTGLALWAALAAPGAWAQEQAPDGGAARAPRSLEPVVVRAELLERRREQSGNSVEILDREALDARPALSSLRDVLDRVPNLTMVTGTGKAPTVRGVDGTGPAENANAFFAGSRPRLSWRIDGRPATYNEVVFGDLGVFDVERIEVLRGPQSTLVGRNAIAGTVAVSTRDPVFGREASVRLAGGDHAQRQVSGMLNLPLAGERVALRLVADWMRKESAVDYDPFPGVADPGRIEGLSLRGKLLVVPDTERDSRLLLNLSHGRYAGPNGEIVVRPFDERRSNFPQQPRHEPEHTSVAADYALQLAPEWELRLNAQAIDSGFTRTAVPGTSSATIDAREQVLEPQLRYTNGRTQAVAGLYGYRARQQEYIEFLGGQHFDDDTDTLAAYAEGVVPLGERLDLSLGLRYERESRRRHGGDPAGAVVRIRSDRDYHALLPKAALNWQASADASWGFQASRGYNAGGGGIAFALPIVNYEYDQETAWTYELYGRQQFLQGRVRTSQNLFLSRYRDMQLPFDLTPDDSRDEAFVVRNAAAARTSGLELGVEAEVGRALALWGSFAWLHTRVTDFPGSGIEDNRLPAAPSFTASAGLSWTRGGWQLGLASRWSDGYYSDVNNRPRGRTDPYLVADAQLSYRIGRARWFVSAKNLFDTDKAVARYPGVAPAGSVLPDDAFDSAVLLQPRSILAGIQLDY